MKTLLVLGSKPDPALPPKASYDHLACANGSGFSAAKHGLPEPAYTVMTAMLTAVASGAQSLQVIAGLKTDTLYFFPRPGAGNNLAKRLLHHLKTLRMKPFMLKRRLQSLGYSYKRFVNPGHDYYAGLVAGLCDNDAEVMALVKRKQPSTGINTLLIGIDRGEYDRFILAGFSFELTHAYANNPEIRERGTKNSMHANTDIAVIDYLSRKFGNIFTTEPTVHERAGIPLLSD